MPISPMKKTMFRRVASTGSKAAERLIDILKFGGGRFEVTETL